jgi:alkylresorcinol/alkylpyrone synthase
LPKIAAIANAVPPRVITQSQAREFAAMYFRDHRRDVERLLPAFDHAGIEERHICMPPEWFLSPKSFPDKNDLYIEWATRLGAEALSSCSASSGVSLSDITHIIIVSTTGLATPSIDSRLVNVLGLSSHIVRTPIWGLGCAGGAAGLGLAYRLAKGDPKAVVALVCVELCSLTFHFEDFSKSNFIATALFADGAAGVIVVGDDRAKTATGPEIARAGTTTWPDSLDVMGWNFDAVGMQVVFSHAIPQIVRDKIFANTAEFLSADSLGFSDIRHWVTHPGGMKVIEAYEATLPMPPCAMTHARAVLRQYGNMSSPTVLFVLERLIACGSASEGELGILTALGPGFSADNLLLRF